MGALSDKPDANSLAIDRTLLAYERTLMAWIRTATSMISFGFTIYKFFQFETAKSAITRPGVLSPRQFAMVLITVGIGSLFTATISYHRNTRRLGRGISMTEVTAACLTGFGILALVGAAMRR